MYIIQETTDYAKFKTLAGNRDIKNSHVQKLKASMQQKHLVNAIIVNEDMEIIDGQHRFAASKELGLPVYFYIVNGYGTKEVQILNTNMQNWNKRDYLVSYCELGNPTYLSIAEFWKQYNAFTITGVAMLLGNQQSKRAFEEGNFVIENIEFSKLVGNRLMDISYFYDGFNRKAFIAAMLSIYKTNKKFDHDFFISKLRTSNKFKLTDQTNSGAFKELIEKIYNYRSRSGTKIRVADLK